jgi:hypothetical protein
VLSFYAVVVVFMAVVLSSIRRVQDRLCATSLTSRTIFIVLGTSSGRAAAL